MASMLTTAVHKVGDYKAFMSLTSATVFALTAAKQRPSLPAARIILSLSSLSDWLDIGESRNFACQS